MKIKGKMNKSLQVKIKKYLSTLKSKEKTFDYLY